VVTKPTNLAWAVTAPAASNIQIHGFDLDLAYSGACSFNGQSIRLTGTVAGGVFNNPLHAIAFTNAGGLTAHSALGAFALTTSGGTLRDDQQSLTVI